MNEFVRTPPSNHLTEWWVRRFRTRATPKSPVGPSRVNRWIVVWACRCRTPWTLDPFAVFPSHRRVWSCTCAESFRESRGSRSDGNCRLDRKYCTERSTWTVAGVCRNRRDSWYLWVVSQNCSRNSSRAAVHCGSVGDSIRIKVCQRRGWIAYPMTTYHGFIDWIRSFVGENARRQTRNDFVYVRFVTAQQDIVVDLDIFSLQREASVEINWSVGTNTPIIPLELTRKSKLLFMLWNRPPTIAAKWITLFGRYLSKSCRVDAKSLQPSSLNKSKV